MTWNFCNLKCHMELKFMKLKFLVMVNSIFINSSSTLAILMVPLAFTVTLALALPLSNKPFLLSLENRVEFESKAEIHTKLKSPIHPLRIQIKLDYLVSIQG